MRLTLKKGVWCWPCLDATGDRVQAVEEIDDDPYCEICARKHRRAMVSRAEAAEMNHAFSGAMVQPSEDEPEIVQPEVQPTAAISEDVEQTIEYEPEVVHLQTGLDDGPDNAILPHRKLLYPTESFPHRQTRRATKRELSRVTVLKAESDEDHEANQAFAALNCEDKWALIEAVLA